MIQVDFKGPFFLSQTLLPMIAKGGSILKVSAALTRFVFDCHCAYASIKSGVEVMTRHMAKELGPRGITVNVIAPGAVETDFAGGEVHDLSGTFGDPRRSGAWAWPTTSARPSRACCRESSGGSTASGSSSRAGSRSDAPVGTPLSGTERCSGPELRVRSTG